MENLICTIHKLTYMQCFVTFSHFNFNFTWKSPLISSFTFLHSILFQLLWHHLLQSIHIPVTTTQFRVQAKQMWCIFSHNLVAVFLLKLPWPTQCSFRPSRYCVKKVHQIKHIQHTKRFIFCTGDSFWLSSKDEIVFQHFNKFIPCYFNHQTAFQINPKILWRHVHRVHCNHTCTMIWL